ncbi:MAG: DUF5319 domain-containing protein [Actinomycetota bacterium]|nr:DUF5319 domain-containing protein [Actinomycetota bacterium]
MRREHVPPQNRSSFAETELEVVEQNLVDVTVLKEVFGRDGIKGAAFCCELCDGHHYLEWELIAGTLQEVLDKGHLRAHEPACDPNPRDYVSWDYACGLLDGYESYRVTEPRDVLVQVIVNDDPATGAG